MPYPNQHAARVRQLSEFVADTFRTVKITNGVNIIVGQLRDGSRQTQTYRFDSSVFTAEQAKNWLKLHKVHYISFEAATSA